jgi:hypothetical protein
MLSPLDKLDTIAAKFGVQRVNLKRTILWRGIYEHTAGYRRWRTTGTVSL